MYRIIQPVTFERNLNGICYMPYWVYAALKYNRQEVEIYEDVSLRELDNIEKDASCTYLIDLSSFPQIEIGKTFYYELLQAGMPNVYFIGYEPLIELENLPVFQLSNINIDIADGIFNYIFYSDDFKYALLSDCDSHIKCADPRKVVPVFFSVGCNRGCPYCYATTKTYPRAVATIAQIKSILDYIIERDFNIHFNDENFLNHPYLDVILNYLYGRNVNWINLTDTITLSRVQDKYSPAFLLDCGNFLNEVGLEVLDTSVLKKKQSLDSLLDSPLSIFWLTMTFLPNDSFEQIYKLGRFLKEFGYSFNALLPRIRTNSTQGGLGQFFQIYPGTPLYHTAKDLGHIYTKYSTRLRPSYIGNIILNTTVRHVREIDSGDLQWLSLYMPVERVQALDADTEGRSVSELIQERGLDVSIVLAQLARLGVIIA